MVGIETVGSVEDLKDGLDTAVAKIQCLNSDNITEDDDYEEFKQYLSEHGLSEEAIEKIIEAFEEWGIELYTSPYFNFYEEYDIEPSEDPLELLKNLVAGYENWAEVEESAAWQGIYDGDEAKWFYDYVQDFYEKEGEEILFSAEYLDARFNRHEHVIKWEQWGKYDFIIYEKSGVGYGREVRVCNACCMTNEFPKLKKELKELDEQVTEAETTDEVLDLIDKAIDIAGFDGRITWAEVW